MKMSEQTMEKIYDDYVYDLEMFNNLHTATFKSLSSGAIYQFVIHESLNQSEEYIKFLRTLPSNARLIGFNNVNYDYPLIHHLLNNYQIWINNGLHINTILKHLKEKSNEIIGQEFSAIREPEVKIPQIDVYRIMHYDNKNRRCSLKQIEIATRWKNVQDLPFAHDAELSEEHIPQVLEYNLNDVEATLSFYNRIRERVVLREQLTEMYNINLINANDPKLGSEIFMSILSKELNIDKYKLSQMRTPNPSIDLNQCIFPYVKFETAPFQALLKHLKGKVITNTKNAFSNINKADIPLLIPYINPKYNKKKTIKNLHVYVNDIDFVFGTGGIHASKENQVFESNDEWVIIDKDVASYYPNLSIRNRLYPEHLGAKFCDIYENIYDTRKTIPKDNILNGVYKLMLNGTYGKTIDKHSAFYNPEMGMKITLNGQLLLAMLIERAMVKLKENIVIIQANTDGVTVYIKRTHVEQFEAICTAWQKMTRLELEEARYKRMFIRDVNNYIAEYEKPKKKKGGELDYGKCKGRAFEIESDFHKDSSMKIVKKAAFNSLLFNISVEDTIYDSTDIFDFCLQMRVVRGWRAQHIKVNETIDLQKNNRYYMSKQGGAIIKLNKTDGRKLGLQKGYVSTIFNQYVDKPFKDYNINYRFYIEEANKIVSVFKKNTQTSLF